MESIEASGKSVDEAVQQALARLGRRRDEVEITVLQEPARGTFGLGSRDARVRVAVRPSSAVITPEMADAILGPDSAFAEEEGGPTLPAQRRRQDRRGPGGADFARRDAA